MNNCQENRCTTCIMTSLRLKIARGSTRFGERPTASLLMFLFFALMAGLLLVLGLIVDQAGEGEATQGCSSQPSAPEEARHCDYRASAARSKSRFIEIELEWKRWVPTLHTRRAAGYPAGRCDHKCAM